MCRHCIGKVSNCSIKSCGRSIDYNSICINPYIKSPQPLLFLLKVFVLYIKFCLQSLMKFHQWLFKILRKQNDMEGGTHEHTDAQRKNSIPSTNKVCEGYTYKKNPLIDLNYQNLLLKPSFYHTLDHMCIQNAHQRGGYLSEQWLSSIVSLFMKGTCLLGNNSLPPWSDFFSFKSSP